MQLLLNYIQKIDPENREVYLQRATICSKNNLSNEAIEILKNALQFIDDKIDRVDNKLNTIHQHVIDPNEKELPCSINKKSIPTAMEQLQHFTKLNKDL